MRKSGGGADSSFGPGVGSRAVWGTRGSKHECECPGPPPSFRLPPPPRPPSLASDCSDGSSPPEETCKAVPVIDSEYRYSPVMPSVTIILVAAVAVVVFLCIGTFLVLLKKRKPRHSFPRKALRNRCDAASANGVVYEDLTNIRHTASSPPQTTLPPVEMIEVAPYTGQTSPGGLITCPPEALLDLYGSRDLFNPIYEELSNGSGERGESNSEGMPEGGESEEEFAEDELSVGREGERRWRRSCRPGDRRNDACRDLDYSDADDRSKFLRNSGTNSRRKEGRKSRGQHGPTKRLNTSERRNACKKEAESPHPLPPLDCPDFDQTFLLRRILHMYPDVTGLSLPPDTHPHNHNRPLPLPPNPDIFSSPQHHSAPGSDSGYSNNTSTGRSLTNNPNPVPS